MASKKYSGTSKLLKFGLILALFSLVLACLFLILKKRKLENVKNVETGDSFEVEEENDLQTSTPSSATNSSVKVYVNEKFGFKFYHPRLLDVREYTDSGDYLSFIRFEETRFTKAKGIAVGVTDRSVEEEVKKIKSEFKKDFNVDPKNESEIKIFGLSATKLEYLPEKDLEARTVIIVNNKIYTYSMSTVPEQIDQIVTSFMFI